jgi:hypothetical protein
MPDGLLLALAFCCCVAGLAWLALAMDVHWRQVRTQRPLSPAIAKALRVMGSAALAASLLLSFAADHASMAALVWIMDLAASALIVAFTFTWRPRVFAPLVAWVR